MKEKERRRVRMYCSQYMNDYTKYDKLVGDIYSYYFLDEEPKDVAGDILHEIMVYKNDIKENGGKYYGTTR